MVRIAKLKDISKIENLLSQVDLIHHIGRPDIFKIGNKYSTSEIENLLNDKNVTILVSVDNNDNVIGYCFCMLQQHKDNSLLTDIKTLYIDDLCIDKNYRGNHLGKELYEKAVELAKQKGCYNLTLNVWSFNKSAIDFYNKQGLKPQKVVMEKIL